MENTPATAEYVGRGALKLKHALDLFRVDAAGRVCADFGSNVGGFTDCLLRAGAARVYAIDSGYGTLAWKLRNDPRVVVMERTNALHAEPPPTIARTIGIVVVDLGWTPQRHAVPAALRWLSPGGRIITLIKPHYELDAAEARTQLQRGVLELDRAEEVTERTLAAMPALGVRVLSVVRSPILGGAGKGNSRGNAEWLALLARADDDERR